MSVDVAEVPIRAEMVLICTALRVLLRTLPRKRRERVLRDMDELLSALVRSQSTITFVRVNGHGEGANSELIIGRAEALATWRLIREAVELDAA